ncbi:Conserved_hypothetical protein [Hexamita inflata]|uniref:Uncharacterized protein n=1 Tax=Hexamita inflata TaxID=28002 RepID=A0ABP1HWE2_9EUKA
MSSSSSPVASRSPSPSTSSSSSSEDSDIIRINDNSRSSIVNDNSKQLLLQAATYLAQNSVQTAKTLAEEALRINPRNPQAYEFIGDLMRNYLHNPQGALQFELAGILIERSLHKLVKIFKEISETFGDSKILRNCAQKILQLSESDQQRIQFYQYMVTKQLFEKKSQKKIYKQFVMSLKNIDNLMQQLELPENKNNIKMKMGLYSRILQQDIDFNDEKYMNLKQQITQVAVQAYEIKKTKIYQELIIMLKSFLSKIPSNLELSLILSAAAVHVNLKQQECIEYCIPQLLKHLELQSALPDNHQVIKNYLFGLTKISPKIAAHLSQKILLIMPNDPEFHLVSALSLAELGAKVDATKHFTQAVNESSLQNKPELSIQARLQLNTFLQNQNTPIETQLKILLPDYQSGTILCSRETYLPTHENCFVKKFFITAKTGEDVVKQIVQTDLRVRTEAALSIFQSESYNKYTVLFQELVFIPLISCLMYQLYNQQKSPIIYIFELIDQVVSDSVKCMRYNTNMCECQAGNLIEMDALHIQPKKHFYSYIHTDQLINKLQRVGIVKLALSLIDLPHATHSTYCSKSRQLLIIQLLLLHHKYELIQLTDSLYSTLHTNLLQLALETNHNDLAYRPTYEKAKAHPENAALIFQLVKLSQTSTQRQNCQKLLKRWGKKYNYLHLRTAQIIMNMRPKAILQKELIEEEYQRQPNDLCLELHMINMYSQLAQSKTVKNREEIQAKVIEHLHKYMDQPETAEYYYNLATVLMNQFGLFAKAAQIFWGLLGQNNGTVSSVISMTVNPELKKCIAFNLQLLLQIQDDDVGAQMVIDQYLTE